MTEDKMATQAMFEREVLRVRLVAEFGEATRLIGELGPDVAWHFGTITNDQHATLPYGRGVCVTINGATPDNKPITVFEKDRDSFLDATDRAIARYRRRYVGESWA